MVPVTVDSAPPRGTVTTTAFPERGSTPLSWFAALLVRCLGQRGTSTVACLLALAGGCAPGATVQEEEWLVGEVRDAETDVPRSGVEVQGPDGQVVVTDREGRFALPVPVSLQLRVETDDDAPSGGPAIRVRARGVRVEVAWARALSAEGPALPTDAGAAETARDTLAEADGHRTGVTEIPEGNDPHRRWPPGAASGGPRPGGAWLGGRRTLGDPRTTHGRGSSCVGCHDAIVSLIGGTSDPPLDRIGGGSRDASTGSSPAGRAPHPHTMLAGGCLRCHGAGGDAYAGCPACHGSPSELANPFAARLEALEAALSSYQSAHRSMDRLTIDAFEGEGAGGPSSLGHARAILDVLQADGSHGLHDPARAEVLLRRAEGSTRHLDHP
jgi:hypothetical protein